MKIYDKADRLILDVTVNDNSYRNRAIMGDHNLTLYYSLAQHVEIPVGSYCEFEGQTYTLMRPEQFKMKHRREYEYTVVFSSEQDKAKIWKFRNPVDGRLKFPLTAKPKEHLQMFVDNMNRRDTGWMVGECIEDVEKLVSYDHDYCWDALTKIATEFKTEFEIQNKRVSLHKVEYDKSNPLPLSYGRGNGFKSGVGRSNSGDTPPVEILFVQGGSQNIDRSKYPEDETLRASSNGCLLLPVGQTIGYDGEHFEDETGYNEAEARHYMVDDLGLSIRNIDRDPSSLAEDSLDRSDDYPKRVGTISKVVEVDKDNNFYDFTDTSIPDDLNYEDYLIEGETMTVIFQSGMLAGREFDVKYYHNPKNLNGVQKDGKRFEIVPQEIDGVTMPNEQFKPQAGVDTYAVFHVMLPDAYIRNDEDKSGASWDMFRAAVKYLYDNEERKYTFTGELDGIWAKKDWLNIGGRIRLGGFVRFTDENFEKDGVLVRITNIKDYVNNPHAPKIELSNETISGTVSSTLKELGATEVIAEEYHKEALQFTKRRFRDAKETIEMIEAALSDNFTNRINPIAVETMSMLVGDERLQFQFVSAPLSTEAIPHNVAWNNDTRQLIAPAGTIQHMTLGIDTISSSHEPHEYLFWSMVRFESPTLTDGTVKYYLYIRAPKQYNGNAGNATFRLETQAHKIEEGEYYWLLVGVLNSEYDGERSFVTLYGFTEVLPGRITTDRIAAPDGESYFDMLNSAMKLRDKFQYNVNGDGELRFKGVLVQSQNGIDEAPLGCYRGEYNSTYTYFNGDEVTYRPTETSPLSSYRCIAQTPITGIPPTNTQNWQVVAAGVTGEPGAPGISPNASFKSTVFIRSNSAPAVPTGGTYDNPVPTGWSDGIPSGEAKLWASTRIFSTDGKSPQQSAWTTPRQMTDTADFDVEFSSEQNPSAPTGHPNTNTQWSNESNESTIWMATSKKSNGVWGEWQMSRIKGESGQDGTSIKVKGTADAHYTTQSEFVEAETPPSGLVLSFANKQRLIDKSDDGTQYCLVASFRVIRNPNQAAIVTYTPRYTEAEEGDGYVMGDGHLYLASGENGWQDIGQFKGDDGAPGSPGKNSYLHIKYANSEIENDWTDNDGETPGAYIGVYADNSPTDQLVWSLYSWKKWQGEDGLGYEYIYKRTTNATAPSTPTETSQSNDFVPDGWTDDPTGVTEDYPYEWICYRKKTEGKWGNFIGSATDNAVAALWAKYGEKGDPGTDGRYTEYRYAANGSTTRYPTLSSTLLEPALWSTVVPTVNKGYYLWMTQAIKSGDGKTLIQKWSTPVRVTPYDGIDGDPGKSPALVSRGNYSSTATYYGTAYRVDCVYYNGAYYATRVDAPDGSAGFKNIVPTNTDYWNPFGASFESIATGLLLAENANIANLIFRNQRLESEASTNGIPNFYIDGLNNIASFAAGNVVFNRTEAKIGWIKIIGQDLIGYDTDGMERLKITPNSLPAASGHQSTELLSPISADCQNSGTISIAYDQGGTKAEGIDAHGDIYNYENRDDGNDQYMHSFWCSVDLTVPNPNVVLYLTDGQYGLRYLKDFNGNSLSSSNSPTIYSATASVSSVASNGTLTNIGSVNLMGNSPQITIPSAGRIRITFSLEISTTYAPSTWTGEAYVAFQGFPVSTTALETIIGKDGIMAIYNGNYMRMHSSEGFSVKVGSYRFRLTSSGIQKSTNDGQSWSTL